MWPCQTIDEEKDRTLAFLQSLIHTIQHLLLLLLAIAITTQSTKLIVLMKMTNGRQSDPTFRFNSFASISAKKGQEAEIATANLSPGFDYT